MMCGTLIHCQNLRNAPQRMTRFLNLLLDDFHCALARMYSEQLCFDQETTALTFERSCLELPVIQNTRTIKDFLRGAPANIVLKYKNSSGMASVAARHGDRAAVPLDEVGRRDRGRARVCRGQRLPSGLQKMDGQQSWRLPPAHVNGYLVGSRYRTVLLDPPFRCIHKTSVLSALRFSARATTNRKSDRRFR